MPVHAAVPASTRLTCADSIEVEYVETEGKLVVAPLQTSFQVRFEDLPPVERPRSFKGQRNFSGLWWLATTGAHVAFPSWVGRDRLVEFDFDPSVVAVAFRPLTLRWRFAEVDGRHTPDYLVRRADGTVALIDVRTRVSTSPHVPGAAIAALGEVGWQYEPSEAPDPIRIVNLRWLAGYRHPRCACADPGRRDSLLRVFAVPRALDDGVAVVGDPIAVRPALFHLLWSGALRADLDTRLLGGDTVIASHPGGVS